MARQEINLGIVPGDKKGDKLRLGGQKINENFTELYDFLTIQQASPVIAAYHLITYEESNQLTGIHVIIPPPGEGFVTELVSMVARVTPMGPPVGGLQVNPDQTLNVSTDGDAQTRDWGFFPRDFIMSQSQAIQRMTPVFSTQIFVNTPVYVCLSGNENPQSGSSQIEFYYLYRTIDTTGNGAPGGGVAAPAQAVHSFINQGMVTVLHNLHKYPTVLALDTTGRELMAEITHESTDQVSIRLNPAASGKIIIS